MRKTDAVRMPEAKFRTAHRKAHWKRAARLTVAALLLLVMGGCTRKKTQASNENFKRAINAYFYNGRDECLFVTAQKFPGEVKGGEKAEMKDMDALASAGFLKRTAGGAFKVVR